MIFSCKKIALPILACLLMAVNLFAQPVGSLLVVNKADHSASLVDIARNHAVAIPVGYGPHEAAVSPSGKTGVVTNYGDGQQVGNTLTVIDCVRKKKWKEISLGDYQRPHGAEFISEEELLVTSEAKSVLLKVNVRTGEIREVANTAQQGSHMVAYSPSDGMAYVANVFAGTVSVLDVANRQLVTVINVKQGIEGIAVTPDGKELWVANRNDNNVVVIDAKTREQLAVLPARQLSFRVKITPDGKYAIVSNAVAGNLSIYDVRQREWLRDVLLTDPTHPEQVPVGITVSASSEYIYVSSGADNHVIEIQVKDWTISRRLPAGREPDGIAFSRMN